jgi:hypothetical protein
MEMPNKAKIGWGIVAVVMVLVSLFFGVKYPIPAQPEGDTFDVMGGARQRTETALRVRNYIINEGELTQTGPVLNDLVFEGATDDTYETTFAVTDPTADRTITFPNSSGTVAFSASAATYEFEGTTANEFETTLNVGDPTADRTVTLADASGTVMLSTLATNAPDAANSVSSASNKLEFEGATANDYETWITPTDATADRTQTLQDASGTVALTSQATDMTLTAVADGGNAGAINQFIGVPRIKLIGGGQGTNPGSQTIALADDTPDGEYAAIDASVVLTADTSYYKHGAKSLKAAWAAGAAATDGFKDAGLGGNASWEDMESVGLLVYSTATWAAGDLTLVLTDIGGARTYNIPALTAANVWTWLEVDITDLAAGTGDSIGDVAILMSAQGEAALGAFDMYLDIAYVWDATDEEALGVAIQQDGILGVINTESGASLVELTDYIVHYESGNDFIVYISDQSTADIAVLAAY